MIIFLSIISFMLDGILSRYIDINSIYLSLFTIVSLVIIYPYFNDNNFRYFKYTFILGLLYDIVYFDTLFYHSFLFIILGFFVILFSYSLSNNIYVDTFITIFSIFLYRTLDYFFKFLFISHSFSMPNLFKCIYSSLLLNIIYCVVIYIFSEIYSKKHKILRSK